MWHVGADGTDVVERVLAREHDTIDAQLGHHARAGLVVHRHLRRAVDLEAGIDALDESNDSDVLHDGRVHAENQGARLGACPGEGRAAVTGTDIGDHPVAPGDQAGDLADVDFDDAPADDLSHGRQSTLGP